MKTIGKMMVAAAIAPAVSLTAAAEEITLADAPRTLVTADTVFSVSTPRSDGTVYPLSVPPAFSFDCSDTDGWTVAADGRVSAIPDAGGSGRYLTSDLDKLQKDNYVHSDGTTEMWVGNWKSVKGPVLQSASEGLKGPCLDFGAKGSFQCLFFDPVDKDGVMWNVMTNVGTVVGVYRSADGGGQLLGGKNYGRDNSVSVTSPILYRGPGATLPGTGGAEAISVGGQLWQGLRRNGVMYSYWSGDWEVVVHNPSTATMEAHGVGVGNPSNIYRQQTTGGQSIAELMIFTERLADEDIRKLVVYLNAKWLETGLPGRDGAGRIGGLTVREPNNGGAEGYTATLAVPAGKTLAVDGLSGGRGYPEASGIVKTGAGELTLNDAAGFGGPVRLEEGRLSFSDRKTPSLGELPANMAVHLDASAEDTLGVVDGRVSNWTNRLWSTWNVKGYNDTASRRPLFVENALNGMPVLDFGSRSDGTWAYLRWSGTPKFATVFAVIDARIQGGGHFMSGNLQREAIWHNRNLSYATKFFMNDGVRADSKAWVNGRRIDVASQGYEAPSWQVVALQSPTQDGEPYYLGARAIAENSSDAGGMRIAEIIGYTRPLSDAEVRDVTAYLMAKWLDRAAPGYAKAASDGVADLQRVIASANTEIHVPAGAVKTVEELTASGRVVKSGEGTLLLGPGSDLAGGLAVRAGSVGIAVGAEVSSQSGIAAGASLHLDAADAASQFRFQEGGTNFVAAWQDMTGRAGAYASQAYSKNIPFLNETDTLNGLPVIDFGEQFDSYSPDGGRWFMVAPQVENARSLYVVYGSQAKGGQIFGSGSGTINDFSRGLEPTPDTPLFSNSSVALDEGEVYTNGVRIASSEARKFKPTGGYQLIEIHPSRGLKFSALAAGAIGSYLHGGCRMGEVLVYERTLSEREKTATRNYLLAKWFPETPLAALPAEPAASPLAGNFAVEAGGRWTVPVDADGKADVMAVSGTVSFGEGSSLHLTGLAALGDLREVKIVVANAGGYEGTRNLSVTGDVAFTAATAPSLRVRADGDLVVSFGKRGSVMIVR